MAIPFVNGLEPDHNTPDRRKRIHRTGFFPKAGRMACRMRKIGGGWNVALDGTDGQEYQASTRARLRGFTGR